MSNKLTSLTGFGEGDPKREPSATSRSAGQIHSASEKARKSRVMDFYRKDGAKSSALNKKMGKSSNYASEGGYSDKAMKRFSANKARKHAEWDKKGI